VTEKKISDFHLLMGMIYSFSFRRLSSIRLL
jgi:hypothetical protein